MEEKDDVCDLHHNSTDLHPRPSGISTPKSYGWVASLLKRDHLKQTATIVDDEIDDKTDTFAPFLPPHVDSAKIDFIDLITFEGNADLQKRCRALCYKYKHLFNDKLNAIPADILRR
jgi:hypothetical protein